MGGDGSNINKKWMPCSQHLILGKDYEAFLKGINKPCVSQMLHLNRSSVFTMEVAVGRPLLPNEETPLIQFQLYKR